jgi:hypothetical protein
MADPLKFVADPSPKQPENRHPDDIISDQKKKLSLLKREFLSLKGEYDRLKTAFDDQQR